MVSIRLQGDAAPHAVPHGSVCTFAVAAPSDVGWQAFVRFEAVVYTTPVVSDGRGNGEVRLFPEAPGAYEVLIVSTSPAGGRAVATCGVTVLAGPPLPLAPVLVTVNQAYEVWAPTGWDALHLSHYEPAPLAAVARHVRAGATAFDVGANLGTYTMQLLHAVGTAGRVYAFEFNPVCVQCLQATVRGAGHGNCTVFPLALGSEDGTLDAVVNYGSTAVGITEASGFFARKPGSPLTVPCARLDTLIATFALCPPDFIKIDVEGAESRVVAGMEGTLAAHRPTLLIELHGRAAADATLTRLDAFGYVIEDLETGRRAAGAAAFMDGLPDRPIQVLCLPR
jgi:FkbM family methyltransferase